MTTAGTNAGTFKDAQALLGRAVHRNRTLSVDGILERLFTMAFRDLVYPQIWEDPRCDLAALELTSSSRLVTIASGGCNVLSYLTAAPQRIYAVDLNHAHVALNRMKYEAVRRLPDHASFFALFGTAESPENPAFFKRYVSPHLDAVTLDYWQKKDVWGDRNIDRFAHGFYRTGLLGWCIAVAHVVARVHGVDPRCMLKARDRQEQIEIFERELAPLFQRPLIRWCLGKRAALYGLGIPPAQYAALLGDADHMADVVCERLRKLACDFDLTDNYFAWQAFNRGYAPGDQPSLPPYLQADNFAAMRANIDRVSIELASFTDFLERQPAGSLDRYVLLDAQDWMDTPTLTHLWSEITRTAAGGARVIFRTAGRDTILPGRLPGTVLDQWHYDKTRSDALLAQDRSAIYGGFHLYVLDRA